MASPGGAGLLASQGLTNSQIWSRIESNATDLGASGRDNLFGYGLVDAQATVTNGAASEARDLTEG